MMIVIFLTVICILCYILFLIHFKMPHLLVYYFRFDTLIVICVCVFDTVHYTNNSNDLSNDRSFNIVYYRD